MQNKERIEGLVETKAIQDFKTSVNTIIVDMTNEGWEYEDAAEYMLSVINGTIRSHKNEDIEQKIKHNAYCLLGISSDWTFSDIEEHLNWLIQNPDEIAEGYHKEYIKEEFKSKTMGHVWLLVLDK